MMRADRYLRLGLGSGLRPPEEAAKYPLTTEQRQYMAGLIKRNIDGDPVAVPRVFSKLRRTSVPRILGL